MRIGLFGGSFDPVHNGHLLLAECCRKQARLDEVWFLPTAVQPLKPGGPIATNTDRLEMLRLATSDHAGFVVSTLEIDRGGVSYTIDTLRELHAELPNDEWFFLMGADSFHDLPKWREPTEFIHLALPLVVHRSGEGALDFEVLADLVDQERLELIRNSVVEMPPTPISSSDLRARITRGEAIHDAVPPSVAEYIENHKLYR